MFSVTVQIDRESAIPVRTQITEAFAQAIRNGDLAADRPLPSVRALSARLGVSPLTVVAAYRELCDQGLASAIPRSGFRVRQHGIKRVEGPRQFTLNRLEPNLRLHPVAECAQLVAEVAAADPLIAGYADYRGDPRLREAIAGLDQEIGVVSDPESGMLITSGAQQAFSLRARTFPPGALIALEEPSYPGARLAFIDAGLNVLPVRMTPTGPDADALRELSAPGRVAAFYCCPTYGNPSGGTWPLAARQSILAAMALGGGLIIEDDFLGDLDYLEESPQRLARLATDFPGAQIVRVRSFSKTLLPALRLASVTGAQAVIQRLLTLKARHDLGCSALLQRALARFITEGRYLRHLQRVRPHYREVRASFRAALVELPNSLRFDDPAAGLCLLGEVAADVDCNGFITECERLGLLLSPGGDYWTNPREGQHRFRITFGSLAIDEIPIVAGILAQAVRSARQSQENLSLL